MPKRKGAIIFAGSLVSHRLSYLKQHRHDCKLSCLSYFSSFTSAWKQTNTIIFASPLVFHSFFFHIYTNVESTDRNHPRKLPCLFRRSFTSPFRIAIRSYMYICIYAYMYICMCVYVCMYVCMYVCIYIYIDIHMYIHMYECMYVCVAGSRRRRPPRRPRDDHLT